MIRKSIIPVAAVIVLFGVSSVYAQPSKKGFREMKKEHKLQKEQFIKDLGLNEDQQAQMEENRKKNLEDNKGLRKRLHDLRQSLKEELDKYGSDPNKIEEITSEMKTIQGEMIDNRVESIQAVKKIMTTEQFEKFKEKVGEFKKRHKGSGRKKWMEDKDSEGMEEDRTE